MNILFFRYNSIYESDVISAFSRFGLHVIEEKTAMERKDGIVPGPEIVGIVGSHIKRQLQNGTPLLFVFSINFYPAISDACERTGTLYVCWSVDCPVMELFAKAIRNSHNRIFLFDHEQYKAFAPYNPGHIFYLPLGIDTKKWDRCVSSISRAEQDFYSCDLSFVGSLYSEKDHLDQLPAPEPYVQGYIDALINAQLSVFGYNFIEEALSDRVVQALKDGPLKETSPHIVASPARYTAAHYFIGMRLARVERLQTLLALAEGFDIDLYTQSDTSALSSPRIRMRGVADSKEMMPKIFHLSKINLNITMRAIRSGLSLRVYDVLGCGGFLITNYQSELPELFEIGKDLEVYTSLEELKEKCAYYLAHDQERRAIAQSGYEKVCRMHTCEARIAQLLSIVCDTAHFSL